MCALQLSTVDNINIISARRYENHSLLLTMSVSVSLSLSCYHYCTVHVVSVLLPAYHREVKRMDMFN